MGILLCSLLIIRFQALSHVPTMAFKSNSSVLISKMSAFCGHSSELDTYTWILVCDKAGSQERTSKGMCQKEIGLCAHNVDTSLGLTVNTMGRAYVRMREPSIWTFAFLLRFLHLKWKWKGEQRTLMKSMTKVNMEGACKHPKVVPAWRDSKSTHLRFRSMADMSVHTDIQVEKMIYLISYFHVFMLSFSL